MFVASAVIACIIIMCAIVSAHIRAVVIGTGEVEMVMIGIRDVNTEVPTIATGINRPVEILGLHKAVVLATTQHPAEVIIAHIQIVIIAVERPFISKQHIIHHIAYTGDEVIIDFIYIIVLLGVQVQFISHLIGEETGFLTYFAITHSVRARAANSSTQSGKQDK